MSAKFYTLLTDIGAAKLASAAALGVPLKITHMAVGDGGGALPTPSAQQTALVAEKRRAALNMLYIDPQNSSQIIAEQVIPENEGGWWIREVGLFDETGALIAVGNCPESYKPKLAEGSGRTQTVRMVLITSSTDNITLKIDPAVVLATRSYVDNLIETRQKKSDALTALAELKPAKGKIPYFTAEKAAAMADLSDFIRPMLGKADAATVLEYLGLRGPVTGTESMLRIPAFIDGKPGEYVIQTQLLSSSTTSGMIVFPEAFNNRCMIIIAVDYASAAIDSSRVRFNIPTKSKCEWYGQTMSINPTPASPSTWAWLAIGY